MPNNTGCLVPSAKGHKDRINLCRAKVQPVGTLLDGLSGLLQPDFIYYQALAGWARASPKTGWALASSDCVRNVSKNLWRPNLCTETNALLQIFVLPQQSLSMLHKLNACISDAI